jgi:hypothetical protein
MSFQKNGVEYGACMGTLISPTELITNATCHGDKIRGYEAKVSCGSETRTTSMARIHDGVVDKPISPGEASDRVLVQNNLAIFSLGTAERPFTIQPARIDFDNKIDISTSSLAKYQNWMSVVLSSPTLVDIPDQLISYFGGIGTKIIASKRVTDTPILGNPLFCKDKDGNIGLKAIASMANDGSIFYARLDQSKDFIRPPG